MARVYNDLLDFLQLPRNFLAAGGQVIPPSPDFQVLRQVILSFEHSCNARWVVTVRYTYYFPGILKVPVGR